MTLTSCKSSIVCDAVDNADKSTELPFDINRLLLAELKVRVWLSVSVNIPAKSTEPPFVKDNCVPTSERVWFALPPNKFPVSVKSPTSAGIVGLFVKLL